MIGIMPILRVEFQLQKTADDDGYAAADRITVINGAHNLIKHLMINQRARLFMAQITFIMLQL